MSTRRGSAAKDDPIARRSAEILAQMTNQLLAARNWGPDDGERLQRIRADFTKLVHWALHDHGDPDSVARIRDCYRRCELDIDDTAVLRRVRGVVKGELRKAGVDTEVPGLDPALDAATIILTTKRTIQGIGGSASALTAPGPALDRKASSSAASPPPPPVAPPPPEEPPPKPHTVKAGRPPTGERRKPVTPAEMQAAFDAVVGRTMAQIQRSGRTMEKADYLAAVYNDDGKKAKLLDQIAAELPPVKPAILGPAVDGFFRAAFRGVYIERTDRQGHRRAHRR